MHLEELLQMRVAITDEFEALAQALDQPLSPRAADGEAAAITDDRARDPNQVEGAQVEFAPASDKTRHQQHRLLRHRDPDVPGKDEQKNPQVAPRVDPVGHLCRADVMHG